MEEEMRLGIIEKDGSKKGQEKGKEYTDGRDCSLPLLFLFPLWLSLVS